MFVCVCVKEKKTIFKGRRAATAAPTKNRAKGKQLDEALMPTRVGLSSTRQDTEKEKKEGKLSFYGGEGRGEERFILQQQQQWWWCWYSFTGKKGKKKKEENVLKRTKRGMGRGGGSDTDKEYQRNSQATRANKNLTSEREEEEEEEVAHCT